MIDFPQLPNERRNFVHKRIGRGIKGFVTSGFNPVSAATAFLAPTRRTLPRTATARPTMRSEAGKSLGRELKFSAGPGGRLPPGIQRLAGTQSIGRPCTFPWRPDPVTGQCALFLGDRTGPDDEPLRTGAGLPVGEAVMGRYGAALEPGSRIIDRAVCLPGMVLGDDGKCYNRSQIKNADRMWPKGRRPLLTGGDMAAISKAARAAGRLERTTKRLQKIGLMKKPSRPQRRITSGSTDHHHHS